MSLIKDTWGQLVRHRLWPVALGLVAAIVAVPMLLAKDPAPAPAPAIATAPATANDAALKPVVAPVDSTQTQRRRHVLGARKDPFKPAPQPKPKTTTVTHTTTTPGIQGINGGSNGSNGSHGFGGSTTPVTGGGVTFPSTPVVTTPSAPVKKKKSYPGDSLTVRFSTGEAATGKTLLETAEGLPVSTPDDQAPLLVYTGLAKGGKEALFLVDASATADGDGHCDGASSTDCEVLHLRAGDTEFFDVTDDAGTVTAQYQLDLLAIHPSKHTRAAAAKAAKTAKAAAKAAKTTKAVTAALATAAGAASAHGQSNLGAGVGALLGSL